MRIKVGVQFLFAKAPICKGFPILFNDNRLCGDSEMVASELFCFSPLYFLTKGLWGVHFEPGGVHLLIISLKAQNKAAKPAHRKKRTSLRP